jgi:hypothetical protein
MVEAVMTRPQGADREAALRDLYEEVHGKHLFPFWATSTDVEHDEISSFSAPSAPSRSCGTTRTTSSPCCSARRSWSRWTTASDAR